MKLETKPSELNAQVYMLILFISGSEANSVLAKKNMTAICDEYLKGHCSIKIVDVLTDFATALKEKIFVTPALKLMSPEPQVMLVGNLSNKERVVSALRLRS